MTRDALDRELLERAAAGDGDAAGALWSRQRRWVATCLLAHAARGTDVDDLLQEVALQMWRGLAELRDPRRFRSWLRSIAVNAARSDGRRADVRRRLLRPLGEDQAAAGDEPARDRLDEVLARLRDLPPNYREPLLLRAVEGLGQREIGELLGLAETTVETRLARARRMLRERVDPAATETDTDARPVRRAVD